MKSQKNILITGSLGMLGYALKQELSSDYNIKGIDIDTADITIENEIKNKILDFAPEVVIHTAAYTAVDNCEINKQLAYSINAEGTKNVANACRACNAKLIYISTDYIFNGAKDTPYTEDDIPDPINVYGMSKLEGEKYVQSILSDYLIVRTSWIYGPGGNNFVKTIIKTALKKGEIKIVNDQTGSPTYTVDLSKAINTLIENSISGIINVANTGECTWFEFGREIIKEANIQPNILPVNTTESARPAKRPKYSVLNTNKFETLTNTKMRKWKEALAEHLKK